MRPRLVPSFAHTCAGLPGPTICPGEPYYQMTMSITELMSLFYFRMGSHCLPIEQDRVEKFSVPRSLRRCTFCTTCAVGDERHCILYFPHFYLGIEVQSSDGLLGQCTYSWPCFSWVITINMLDGRMICCRYLGHGSWPLLQFLSSSSCNNISFCICKTLFC